MAGQRRRTTFAAPFVITIAASCSTKPAGPPPAQEAVRTWTVTMRDMKCEAVENKPGKPPAPQAVECPPGMASETVMQVSQQPGKSYCMARNNVTGCPLPYGEHAKLPLQVVWMIEKEGANCHAEELSNCAKGADCNPPKPRYFPCPPEVTENHPLVLAELPDATCVKVPNGCEDTGCAREPVACVPANAKRVNPE